MRIILLIFLLAGSATAKGKTDPSCSEGFSTFVDTRISGAANPSLQRHRFKNRKMFSRYDCERCPKGAVTVLDDRGWNICLGGISKTRCGAHAAPVPTGASNRPEVCVPCAPGERQVIVNGTQRCLAHACEKGTAPVRRRGVVESYRCTEPYEDPDLIVWEKITPPAPQSPPETPACGEGEGMDWDAAKGIYFCAPCGPDRVVLRRNGYPVCGNKTEGLCGKNEAYVPTGDLSGRYRCEKCPKRHRFSLDDGTPRCLPKRK